MSRERDERSMGTADFLAGNEARQDLHNDADRHMDAGEREREQRRMMVDPDARMEADRVPERGIDRRIGDSGMAAGADERNMPLGQRLAQDAQQRREQRHEQHMERVERMDPVGQPAPMHDGAAQEGAMHPHMAASMPAAADKAGAAQPHLGQGEHLEPLFDAGASQSFRSRWSEVQIGFVDDPRDAVKKADELVAQVMHSLAESFARQRANIEHDVGSGDQLDTEKMRVALRRYRSFFERLLTL